MSKVFTRKGEVKEQLDPCLLLYEKSGLQSAVALMDKNILQQKIKFPLLEFCAHQFLEVLKKEDQIPFCDQIEKFKTIGGHVLIGIILQSILAANHSLAIEQAKKYISLTDSWHACDIIGERVFGVALLTNFKKAYPEIVKIAQDDSQWVVRSMGAGIHYSIKKGLEEKSVEKLFELLLTMANNKNKEIKQGVGWAAKTTAKFHPEIIERHRTAIDHEQNTGAWFRTKVRIGLSRHKYARKK